MPSFPQKSDRPALGLPTSWSTQGGWPQPPLPPRHQGTLKPTLKKERFLTTPPEAWGFPGLKIQLLVWPLRGKELE